MQVTLNIEASQMGETVYDLFQNLPKDKKEELALQILKEWLIAPEYFEIPNYEQILLHEFKSGKRSAGYNANYDENTPDSIIRGDYRFRDTLEKYKTSKQTMAEEIKKEVIEYYIKHLGEEIKESEEIAKLKEETYKQIAELFPSIIYSSLVDVFSDSMVDMKKMIRDSFMRSTHAASMLESIRNKIGGC